MGVALLVSLLLGGIAPNLIAQTTLYYKGSGALNDVASWGVNTDGSGGNNGLTDFTGANFRYIIQNTTNILFNSGTWTVSGTGTKVFMGNPDNPAPAVTLTIAAGAFINTAGQLFDVPVPSSGTHKIVYQNANPISVGTVDPNLELVFDGAKFSTSTSRTYGNATLMNGAEIDLSGATGGPTFNNLTIHEGCLLTAAVGGSAGWIGIKSSGVVTINGHIRVGRTGGLFTPNVAFPVVANTAFGNLLFNSSTVTQGNNLIIGPNSTIEFYRGSTGQTAAQTIQALNYANLIFSNASVASNKIYATGDITVSGNFTINMIGAATITAPTTQNITLLPNARLVINSATAFPTPTGGGRFTLESGPSGTASIGTLVSGASIVGNVTVKQFIPGGSRRYRFVSHPFSAAQSLSQLTDEIDITGNTAGTMGQPGQTTGEGFTSTFTNNPSAFFFNTAAANGDPTNDGGWTAFTSATSTNWNVGQGIRVLIRGTKGQSGTLNGTEATPEPVTLSLTGAVNTGNISIPLVTGGTGSTANYNLVGNPYPSPVDIGAVLTAAGSNVGNAFYLRNPQTSSYITVSPIPASYVLPANTAFFVRANAATNLNFTEQSKNVCTSCPTILSVPGQSGSLQIQILQNGQVHDNLGLNIGSSFSNKKDNLDAEKLMNDGLSIYTLSTDKEMLAVNYMNSNINTIPLGIALPKLHGRQTYQLKVDNFQIENGYSIRLYDRATNQSFLLQKGATYDLSIDPALSNQIGENRLEFRIEKK